MKLQPQTMSVNGVVPTAYRLTLGSRKAREVGLLNKTGQGKDFLIVPTKSYIMLLTVENTGDSLSYRNCSTTIFQHGNIFFGEVAELPSKPTWYATTIETAEKSFHALVDSVLGSTCN